MSVLRASAGPPNSEYLTKTENFKQQKFGVKRSDQRWLQPGSTDKNQVAVNQVYLSLGKEHNKQCRQAKFIAL